jgi:hypothetical protein
MRLKSRKKTRKPDIWVTEISVKDRNVGPALMRIIALVRKYEDISRAEGNSSERL